MSTAVEEAGVRPSLDANNGASCLFVCVAELDPMAAE